jgi:hypothetical protein
MNPKHKETRGGKSGMTVASLTDDPINLDTYIAAASKIVIGQPKMAVAMETGLVREQARRVGTICGISVEEFREHVRIKGQEVLAKIEEMALADIEALSPMQRQITYGIRMDKYRDITGGTPPTVVHQTNIQVNGADRQTMMNALKGGAKPFVAPTVVHSNTALATDIT